MVFRHLFGGHLFVFVVFRFLFLWCFVFSFYGISPSFCFSHQLNGPTVNSDFVREWIEILIICALSPLRELILCK